MSSPWNQKNAEWMLAGFKEWGWDAHIENFDVLFPTPNERYIELIELTKYIAKLEEPPISGDPTSHQQAEQLRPTTLIPLDGDLTGPQMERG